MASSAPQAVPPTGGRVWQFADCEFDERRWQLRVRNQPVELERKPLEILQHLLLRAGEVVRKEELLEAVWPAVMVVDASLATAVSKLRKALGDDSIIRTVPKVGYQLCAVVHCRTGESPQALPPDVAPISTAPADAAQRLLRRRVMAAACATLLFCGVLVGITSFRTANHDHAVPRAIAILPFQNVGANPHFDYLRSALPDQIANSLSMARSLNIRPVAATGRYADPSLDLRQAARELDVDTLIAGHYVVAGDQLQITMEAIDPDENRIVWQETVDAPTDNLLSLQAQVAAISRGSLARGLGLTQFADETLPAAHNEEAYELYLRSVALDWDPEPTRQALQLLQKSVALDPNYAPAWGQLTLRYYTMSRFAGGGPAMLQLADAAAERQLALDPDSPGPVAELTIHRTERGDLVQAHQQAIELLRRRPDNPNNHHVLSYVLRYGGSLDEAGRECDLVVLLATRLVWGSCSTTFMELGNYNRARDFIRKDLSSEWSKAHAIEVDLREGKTDEAIRIGAPKIPHWDSYKMLLACAAHQSPEQIKKLAAGVEVDDDPEVNYFFAGHLAYCGQTDAALRMLKLAIARNYCSYPAMDKDPFFDHLRDHPEFARIRQAGIDCHDSFVANRLPAPRINQAETGPVTAALK